MSPKEPTVHEFAEALRKLARWYEEHPDIPRPSDPALCVYAIDHVDITFLARTLGTFTKEVTASGGLYMIARDFGGVVLRFVYNRDTVCTKRVVGTRTVPATPAQPACPEHEEEIVEWDCPHSLLGEVGEPNHA